MNNRSLLTAVIGLLVAVPAYAGIIHAPIAAQMVKHVVPYESYVWNDDSTEIVVLVRVNETGMVKELGVNETTGEIFSRSKFDKIRLIEIEPFIFEGQKLVFGGNHIRNTRES